MNDLTLLIEDFRVVLIPTGGAYGLNDCLTATEPLVEFHYERFMSRYCLDTLINGWRDNPPKQGEGLCVDGGTMRSVSGTGMDTVRAWLRGYLAGFKKTNKG